MIIKSKEIVLRLPKGSFSVDSPKRKHYLVFYDKRTRKPLAKISIDNVKTDLKLTEKEMKKKRKKEKNASS